MLGKPGCHILAMPFIVVIVPGTFYDISEIHR